MILYIVLFLILAFLGFINLIYKDKSLLILPFISLFLVFFSLAAFRFETGPDYSSYEIFFNEIDYNLIGFLEPLFVFLTVFLRENLGLHFQSLLIIIAFVAISCKFWFIFKTIDYWFIGLLFYFCNLYLTGDVGQIRQGVAVGFALVGFYHLVNNRLIPFYIFILLAMGFHFSATICLLAPFIVKLEFSKRKMIIIWLIALAIGLLMSGPILQPILGIILPAGLSSKVLGYLEGDSASLGISLGMLVRFCCLILGLNAIQNVKDKKYRKYVNLYFFGGIILFLFNFNGTFASRLSSYFLVLDFMLISFSLFTLKFSYSRIAVYLFFVLINFYTLFQQITSADSYLIPYKSIFFK